MNPFLFFLTACCLSVAFSESFSAPAAPLSSSAHSLLVDKTPEQIEGKIVDLWKVPSQKNDGENISILVLDAKNARVFVQMGPTWTLSEWDRYFKTGQPVSAVGFRVELQGQRVFIPKEIKVENKILLFPLPQQIEFPAKPN